MHWAPASSDTMSCQFSHLSGSQIRNSDLLRVVFMHTALSSGDVHSVCQNHRINMRALKPAAPSSHYDNQTLMTFELLLINQEINSRHNERAAETTWFSIRTSQVNITPKRLWPVVAASIFAYIFHYKRFFFCNMKPLKKSTCIWELSYNKRLMLWECEIRHFVQKGSHY